MSNKLLRISTALLLHLGILLSLEGDVGMLKVKTLAATVTHDLVTDPTAVVLMAEEHASYAGWSLGMGIAMILLGFALHGWLSIRDERPVRVHQKKKTSVRVPVKPEERWFWVHMHI